MSCLNVLRQNVLDERTHARNGVVVADALGKEPVPNLPGEDGRAFPLVIGYFGDDTRRGHPWFRAANSSRFYRTRFVVPKSVISTEISFYIITLRNSDSFYSFRPSFRPKFSAKVGGVNGYSTNFEKGRAEVSIESTFFPDLCN